MSLLATGPRFPRGCLVALQGAGFTPLWAGRSPRTDPETQGPTLPRGLYQVAVVKTAPAVGERLGALAEKGTVQWVSGWVHWHRRGTVFLTAQWACENGGVGV